MKEDNLASEGGEKEVGSLSDRPIVDFSEKPEKKEDIDTEEEGSVPIPSPEVEHVITESAWIPPWDTTSALNSLKIHNTKFATISPVWYSVNPDGTLVDRRDKNSAQILANKGNAKVLPSIAISNADILHQIVANPTSLTTHVDSIHQEVINNGYDGIDIDYEMIYLNSGPQFKEFIERLTAKLNSSGKTLSLTLLPKWGDKVTYSAFPETREVQDYAWAGRIADEVRIMTYDYTSSGSKAAGPIAPISWYEDVLEYSVSKIPKEKLVMGIHLYGYEWGDDGKASAKTYSQAEALKTQANYTYEHDLVYAEGRADYQCLRGGKCVLYFQDKEGIETRKELAKKYKIKGVVYWRLGGEGVLLD